MNENAPDLLKIMELERERLRIMLTNCLDFIGCEDSVPQEFRAYADVLCKRIRVVLGIEAKKPE